MNLANPIGLLGLLGLPVIVALHLLRERQHRYVVSHLNLWSFLNDQVQGPRARRIPLSLLLLVDLTIGALLSLAWTQPRVNLDLPVFDAHQVVLLIDVSSSMLAKEGITNRIAQAKSEALSLLNEAGRRDVVTVLAFGRNANWIGDSRQMDRDQLAAQIENLAAGETGHTLPQAVALGMGGVDASLPTTFHILTDGAFSEDPVESLTGFPYPIEWHLVGQEADNQAVIELTATPLQDKRYQVFARIANFGPSWKTRMVVLEGDGQPIDQARVEIPADSAVPQIWEVEGDYTALTLALRGSDNLEADDTATIGLRPGGQIRVLLVAEKANPLQQALLAVPDVALEVLSPTEYEFLGRTQAELTVFRNYLPVDLPDSHFLIVEPPQSRVNSGPLELISETRRQVPNDLPIQSPHANPVLADVDLGGVRWGRAWVLESIPEGFATYLQAGDLPLLLRGTVQTRSNITRPTWVLLADLESGNFTKHPAFPIMIANLVQSVRQSPVPASVHTGEAIPLPSPAGLQGLRIALPGASPMVLSPPWSAEWEHTLQPGPYHYILEGREGGSVEYVTGVNAGEEQESDIRRRTWTQTIQPGLESSNRPAGEDSRLPAQAPQPVDLTPWLLGLAILFLFWEARLAWRP